MARLSGQPPSVNESVKRIIDANQSSMVDYNIRRLSWGTSSIELDGNGLVFRSTGDAHFELRDSAGNPTGNIYINGNLITASGGTFLDLTDTPDSYSGNANKYVKVNSGGTALEFIAGGVLTASKMEGSGCAGSAEQPYVECSPSYYPCDVWVVAGKGGKIRFRESA